MCAQSDREERKMSTYKNYLYSFEDVQKQAKDYGFEDSYMSEADWDLARKDPNRGMALVNAKNDWLTAETPEQKAWSHALAEDLRQQGGSYSGGADGSKFVPTGTQQHDSAWEDTLNATVRNLQNRKFEWSPETDPNVKYYEDAYRREGERAMKDVLGAVAATTGGIPSSYATAAAAQQRNYYAQQMADKYPELYQQAFDRFMQEYDREYQMLDAYMRLDDTDYNRWSDQQERDRNARLDMADAEQRAFENDILQRETDSNIKYREDQTKIALEELDIAKQDMDLKLKKFNEETRQAAEQLALDWARLIQDGKLAEAEMAYKNSALDLEAKAVAWDYAVSMAQIQENARQFDADLAATTDYRNKQLEQNETLAGMEDQLARDKMSADAYKTAIELAVTAAEMGDLSLLEELGVDTSVYQQILDEQLNGADADEEMQTEDEIVDAVVESIMKKPDAPNGYDLNAVTIDTLAAEAPAYKAKADAEKAAQEQENVDNYGAKYAKYLNGETMSKDELKNINDALERWIGAYRSGEDLTAEALAAVERYNNENVMKELFDRYRTGGQMLGVEEAMMKSFVEDAYNRRRAGQKVTPIEQGILDIWLGGRNVKVGKYW